MADWWANFSSSSFQPPWNYDVYFSFSQDALANFTRHLYNAFCQQGIRALMDEKLERGKEISQALIRGIEQSRNSIIIFSKNYASSTWCLDQLANIVEFRETRGQLVIPVSYYVAPPHVRYQTGIFGRAMNNLRFKVDSGRIQRWRFALKKAAELSGWLIRDGYDSEYIQKIAEDVVRRLGLSLWKPTT